jgi:hypothetical protein
MTSTLARNLGILVATLAYLGLAILAHGGFDAFFSHPALITLLAMSGEPLRDIKKFWASVMRQAGSANFRRHDNRHICLPPGLERLEPRGGWASAGPHPPEHDQALRPPCR